MALGRDPLYRLDGAFHFAKQCSDTGHCLANLDLPLAAAITGSVGTLRCEMGIATDSLGAADQLAHRGRHLLQFPSLTVGPFQAHRSAFAQRLGLMRRSRGGTDNLRYQPQQA
ncbi:hypothetical protein D3C80_1567320 [compost metagenome]